MSLWQLRYQQQLQTCFFFWKEFSNIFHSFKHDKEKVVNKFEKVLPCCQQKCINSNFLDNLHCCNNNRFIMELLLLLAAVSDFKQFERSTLSLFFANYSAAVFWWNEQNNKKFADRGEKSVQKRDFLFATPIGHPSQLILLLMMSIILPIYRFTLSFSVYLMLAAAATTTTAIIIQQCCLAIVWQFLASKQSVIGSKKLFLFSDWRQTGLFFLFLLFVAAEWEAIMTTLSELKLCVLANYYYYCHYGGRLGSQRRMQNTVIVIIDVVNYQRILLAEN